MKKPYTPKKRTYQSKAKLIQLIHIGKSQLCFDDGTYQQMLSELTGKESTTLMNIAELNIVLDNLKRLGFKVKPKQSAKKIKLDDAPQSKLIRHLWLTLHGLDAVKNPSEAALAKYVERITEVPSLDKLSTEQASMVIETLKAWLKRVEHEKQ